MWAIRLFGENRRQRAHDPHGLEADAHHLTHEADDVLRIVLAIGVGLDAAAFVFGDAVLIHDPFERGAVAEPVLEGRRRNAGQRERRVDGERGLVFIEPHLVFDAVAERVGRILGPLERPRFERFVLDVEAGQFAPGGGEGGEIGSEGDARQLAFQVVRELLPVGRMVQDGVDVVEDVPLGDGGVTVLLAELFEGGVGDVLAVGAVGGVGVEGESCITWGADPLVRAGPPEP